MNETTPVLDTAILQRTMGNSKSGVVSREVLNDLKVSTKFSEAEITQWYENFQKQCPSGRITLTQFEEIYGRFFPNSDAKTYAQHVFRSFDTNDDGTLDFKEYIVALHMTSSGKMSLKLEWAFSLFDVDKNGYITKNEVCEICQWHCSRSSLQQVELSVLMAALVCSLEQQSVVIAHAPCGNVAACGSSGAQGGYSKVGGSGGFSGTPNSAVDNVDS
ncbi:hypothetical protein AOLI_G00315140 [Acnodon oligacanthus]